MTDAATTDETSLDLIAACAFGLESIVRRELLGLGVQATIGDPGRVHFRGSWETVCQSNLWLRTADRILIRIAEFPAADFDALFETTRGICWADLIPAEASFPVTGRSVRSALTSVPAVQRSVKRAVVDALQRDHSTTELPESGPEFKIDVGLLKDQATLTLDTTGRSLHRRGYRTRVSRAPLKETLAAAMILLSYWKSGRPLIDPFCGSGTIPIEAALIGRNIAPGRQREFAWQQWPQYDPQLWAAACEQADAAKLPQLDERIHGSDQDGRILTAARDNAERAGVDADVHFQSQPVNELSSRRRFGCVICNPPYGQRIGRDDDVQALYRSLPDVLRRLPTWSHYFLTAHQGFERDMGRRADRRRKLYNGRIECTFYQYHGPKPITTRPAAVRDAQADRQPVACPGESVDDSAESVAVSGQPARSTEKPYLHAVGDAAFGQLGDKARHQADLFAARLRKRVKHLRRWPTRRGITCFRLYERDIPEIPLIVDRYEDHLHITEYERPHDRDPATHGNWLDLMSQTAADCLQIPQRNVFLKRRNRQRGKTQHEKQNETQQRIEVAEGGLKFLVNLADYVDTGLFLDHRITRAMVREEAANKSVLNLFAYTGSFTVYAADGGAASTTSVDLSSSYLDWAADNMSLNGFTGQQHRYIVSDIESFIADHAPEPQYDLVILDPPTYSNSKRTDRDWNVQTDAVPLINRVIPLLHDGGVIFFSTNFRRFKLDANQIRADAVHEISRQTVPDDFRNRRIHRCWKIAK